MKWLLIGLVRGYQLLVGPFLGQTCRYYPSCSAYALEAVQRHGSLKGSWLAVRRLGRCHPWSDGGVDHVPGHQDRYAAESTPERTERSPELPVAAAAGTLPRQGA